jgi:hypothetical protein
LVDRPSKSPELNLFAQLCGFEPIEENILDVYKALRACISLGERGWGLALALLNVILGGSTAVPDAVAAIPPGYLKYVKRVSLVNYPVIEELLPDIVFPLKLVVSTEAEDKEKKPVMIVAKRYPKAFGVFIEYERPDLSTGNATIERSLWIIYEAGTGQYPYKAFLAPSNVAERVAKLLDERGALHLEEGFKVLDEAKEILKRYSYEEIEELKAAGKSPLPEGVEVRPIVPGQPVSGDVERPMRPRRHRSPPP